MTIYRGLFPDWFHEVEADSEEDAQKKLREALIAHLDMKKEPFIVWNRSEHSAQGKRADEVKP